MKELYITEEQRLRIEEFIKENSKKVPAAQDQVGNKVNAGIMDAVACGGMCEGAEPESTEYHIGMENNSNLEYGHVNENANASEYEPYIKSMFDYFKSEGLNIYPYPKIELNNSSQDGLFIKTGYYLPSEKKIVIFTQERHIKDCMRSIAHELIHHMQNLEGQNMNFGSEDNVKDNKALEKLEAEAYLKGNIYFRKWTEFEQEKENSIIAEWFVNEKPLLNENVINESVSSIIYHYTSASALYRILLSDKFFLKTGAFKTFADSGGGKRMFFLSTTRNKNAHEGYSDRFIGRGGVRITLDGDKLNQKYHGSSFNYWGDGELGRMKYLNPEKVGFTKQWNKTMQYHRDDETEDRVWSYKSSIPNANDYILKIDICISDIEKDNDLKQLIFNIYNTSKIFTKKINLYADKESFAIGNNNTVIPEWLHGYGLYSDYNKVEKEHSIVDNIRSNIVALDTLAAGLALMTYFEPNQNKEKKIIEYCKKYGLLEYLNSNLLKRIKQKYENNIQDIANDLNDWSRNGNIAFESKIKDMVSHWMRKNNYSTIKDILQQHDLPQYVYEGICNPMVDESLSPEEVDLSSFNIKKNLNPKFWKDGKLDSRIRMKLLDIADDFIEFLGVDWVKPKDIIITGSLANYNWNEKYSDIDLHVLLDYNKVDKRKDFVSNYFHALKNQWNEEHEDLKIFGFPVEVYVQDIDEIHTASGVYSLEKNEWIEEPERDKLAKVKVNKTNIKKEVSIYTKKIDKLYDLFQNNKSDNYKIEKIHDKAEKLFDEIKTNRRKSLNGKNTEITEDNIIFKSLRRLGYIEKLVKIMNDSYNILNSLS